MRSSIAVSVRHDGALALFLLGAFVKVSIDYFMFAIAPVFGIYGVEVTGHYHSSEYWHSWGLFIVVVASQIRYLIGRGDIFDCALGFIFYSIFIPVLSYSWVVGGDWGYVYYCALFWFSLFLLLDLIPARSGFWGAGEQSCLEAPVGWLYLALVGLLGILMLRKFGLGLDFGFESVYERRKAFAEWRAGGLVAYLYSWSVYVFAAYLIFVSKPFFLRLVGVAYLIYFFGIAGDKVYLFLLGLVFLLRFASLRGGVGLLLFFIVALVAFGSLMFLMVGDVWVAAIVNRFLVLPVDISFNYVGYFGEDLLLYSYSFLSSLFEYSFSSLPAVLIGSQYYVEGDSANVNFLTDAYVNLGWISMLPLLLFFFLLRAMLRDTRYLVLVVPLLVQMLNTPLPTLMLTGGGGVMIVSCYLLSQSVRSMRNDLETNELASG